MRHWARTPRSYGDIAGYFTTGLHIDEGRQARLPQSPAGRAAERPSGRGLVRARRWDDRVVVSLVVVLFGLPGLAGALISKPFAPAPSLAGWRTAVVGIAGIGAGILMFSLTRTWWVIDDVEREETITAGAGSALVLAIVAAGLGSAWLTALGAWGGRNWALLMLNLAWPLLGLGWFTSTGELVDSDAGGDARIGLALGTWSLLVVSIAAVLASVLRLAEHRKTSLRFSTRPE